MRFVAIDWLMYDPDGTAIRATDLFEPARFRHGEPRLRPDFPRHLCFANESCRLCKLCPPVSRESLEPVNRKGVLILASLKCLRENTENVVVLVSSKAGPRY